MIHTKRINYLIFAWSFDDYGSHDCFLKNRELYVVSQISEVSAATQLSVYSCIVIITRRWIIEKDLQTHRGCETTKRRFPVPSLFPLSLSLSYFISQFHSAEFPLEVLLHSKCCHELFVCHSLHHAKMKQKRVERSIWKRSQMSCIHVEERKRN